MLDTNHATNTNIDPDTLQWLEFWPGEIAHVRGGWYILKDEIGGQHRHKLGYWDGDKNLWSTPFEDGGFALLHGWERGWEASEPCLSIVHAFKKILRWNVRLSNVEP